MSEMQSDVLNDEYNRKLTNLIEFFKTEKEGQMYFQNLGIDEGRYYFNATLSTIVIFIGISNVFLIAGLEFKIIALIFLLITIFMMGLLMFTHLRSSNKRIKNIVHETNKYNIIINNLQSLKTLPYEVDLSKLNDKIKYRYHLKTTPFVDENYIFEPWFEEVYGCLTEINKEIFEKEKVLKSTRIETI